MRAEYKRDILKELDMLLETGLVSKIYMDSQELWLYQKAMYPATDKWLLRDGTIVPFYMDELIASHQEKFFYKDIPIGFEGVE